MTKHIFLKKVAGVLGSGKALITYTSGATSTDLMCAQFFMAMQDRDATIEEVRAYVKVGHLFQPDCDWNEAERILNTF